ncbi:MULTISPECIES: DUF4174 domain-containing protein [Paracoccus]|jgi:hypothetical protein|uniref:DUF4174 domain-containing protein n=1 Tax=Paracoccus litorisediminis TaxID=2006130 RepID=A0A844HG46_9RHOB|nr:MULTISPECIES: DUF4174 domain-containing protein [Paracoccus]MBD9525338.1 DUF4174 domain-containing protein [Paracoccus sp. PAR01]MTH57769.1 DUF4174 domain-containing protein [Paracoccus litorisediminis]
MKANVKRLILIAFVPLIMAMGARTDGAHQPYVRGEVPAARDGSGAAAGTATEELRFLPAAEADPAEFLWQARPVVVFADTAASPAYVEQIAALRRDANALILRDVVVIIDTDPAANSIWRRQLRPEGFSLVLLDKDGQVKQRKPAPWSAREISRAIDKFPLRLQEIGRAAMH